MTIAPQHQELSGGKWQTLTFAEQMGNVGSEVGRAISWQKKNNEEYKQKALGRAFELLDLTINDKRWHTIFRLQELLRTREVMADYFYGENIYGSSAENLERYFYYFAYAARKGRL